MPTKKRVAKEKEEAELLKVPDKLKNLFKVEPLGQKPTGGLIQTIGDDLFLHPNTGTKRNDYKQEDRAEKALTLKKKYSDIWCKRSGPKVIAMDEGLSERTIQKYMKDFP